MYSSCFLISILYSFILKQYFYKEHQNSRGTTLIRHYIRIPCDNGHQHANLRTIYGSILSR